MSNAIKVEVSVSDSSIDGIYFSNEVPSTILPLIKNLSSTPKPGVFSATIVPAFAVIVILLVIIIVIFLCVRRQRSGSLHGDGGSEVDISDLDIKSGLNSNDDFVTSDKRTRLSKRISIAELSVLSESQERESKQFSTLIPRNKPLYITDLDARMSRITSSLKLARKCLNETVIFNENDSDENSSGVLTSSSSSSYSPSKSPSPSLHKSPLNAELELAQRPLNLLQSSPFSSSSDLLLLNSKPILNLIDD